MTQDAVLRRDRRRRPRLTVTGVAGEVLLTLGVVVLLYVVWQLWVGDAIIGAQRNAEGTTIAEEWETPVPTDAATPSPSATPAPSTLTAPPPEIAEPGDGEVFGVLRVPRWGDAFAFPVAGGVSRAVTLDPVGIGHYPDTAMPGQTGNFALAGHRGSNGAPFQDLPSLRLGDAVVLETEAGWYTYRFRNIEYVDPSAVDVLLPVPQAADLAADGSYLTMTTCSPRYGSAERLIAYGVFESFTPREAGAPASVGPAAA